MRLKGASAQLLPSQSVETAAFAKPKLILHCLSFFTWTMKLRILTFGTQCGGLGEKRSQDAPGLEVRITHW